MKKLDKVMYYVLGFLGLCLVFGCLDPQPDCWSIDQGNWEVWKEGTVISLGEKTESGERYIKIVFSDGQTVNMGAVKDRGRIKIGSTGKLYKCNNNNKDAYSWFQWIENEKKDITAKQKVKEVIIEKVIEITKAEWKRADIYLPQPYKTVIIKLDNGIITTAYLTNTNEWKLEFYKNKLSGGISLKGVVDWTELYID